MECERVCSQNRQRVNAFIQEHWHSETMILRGREIDMTKTEGFCFCEDGQFVGLVTYIIYDDVLEITSLDSLHERRGIGSRLLELVRQEAKVRKAKKIVLITTNDNINAIRFYQKRGCDMAGFFRNALDVSRRLKPEIPLIGENSIPLRHEIEFEMLV